ncbi:MAG TPA: phosphoenolpyruvate--protein phosphotransferase [Candidatus Dormibacteraeota bacterium]
MAELALYGVSAAPGVTHGTAFVLDRARERVVDKVSGRDRTTEVARARDALQRVAANLEAIAGALRADGRQEEADIVETGVLMAMDPELAARVEVLVLETGLDAAEALREATQQLALELSRLDDPTLAQRADDVRSVGRRAAENIEGASRPSARGVLVASTLGPADVAELASTAQGIALAGGGITAHAAIVARSLGLPMVVGAGAGLLEIADGEEVVVDGDRGIVVRRPDAERVAIARDDAERRAHARQTAVTRRLEPAVTTDGHRVCVLANASTVAELDEASQQGAEGVGLLRSELQFLEAAAWPTPDQQVRSLRPVLEKLAGTTATVRLFDFGGDKTPPFLRGTTSRGIDLLLEAPEALKTQLAAIVEAGARSELRILVPMVTGPGQLDAVRNALASVLAGRPQPRLGAMVETPEAAQAAGAIAKHADFLSIGTNDLTQLVLGLDREQSKVAPVLDIRVLRMIAGTVEAAHAVGIPVDVCGEAASDPAAMPVLVGLGVDELSVAAARVGLVRQRVRELSYAGARDEAERLLHQSGDTGGEGV